MFEGEPADPNMPDEVWETYWILVHVNNSLNACEGISNHLSMVTDLNRIGDRLSKNFRKAQETILYLLESSGRLERYDKWLQENQDDR